MSYYKRKDGKIILDAFKMEVFLPVEFFQNELAYLFGDKLCTFGIFKFRITFKENTAPKWYLMNIPSLIMLDFQKEYPSKECHNEEGSYRVFELEKDDVILESETMQISSSIVELFIKLLHSGKLPVTSYEGIYNQYMKAQEDSGIDLGVPSSAIESIVAEFCRSKKNPIVPYRIALGKKEVKEGEFSLTSLKALPELISTFSGISFENIDKAMMSGIKKSRMKEIDRITPLEKSLKTTPND